MRLTESLSLALYSAAMRVVEKAAPWTWRRRARRDPNYYERATASFDPPQWDGSTAPIWVHAVSVGEFLAARPLLEHWHEQGHGLFLTTTTPTAAAQVRRWIAESRLHESAAPIAHAFFPVDRRRTWRRWLETLSPERIVVVETELWPLLIREAHRVGVPVWLLNGRLSKQAARRYAKASWLFAPVWQRLSGVVARSPWDARRFRVLGVLAARIHLCGDLKTLVSPTAGMPASLNVDASSRNPRSLVNTLSTGRAVTSALARSQRVTAAMPSIRLDPRPRAVDAAVAARGSAVSEGRTSGWPQWAARAQQAWADSPVLVIASTHEGEEALLFEPMRALQRLRPDLVVVLAPRHPHRSEALQSWLESENLAVSRWSALRQSWLEGNDECVVGSANDPAPLETSPAASKKGVVLVDVVGDLAVLQAMAHCVWLGGSWVDVGGHNPLEALRAGVLVVTGPHVHNFAWWMHRLERRELIRRHAIDSPKLIDATLNGLDESPEQRIRRQLSVSGDLTTPDRYSKCLESLGFFKASR